MTQTSVSNWVPPRRPRTGVAGEGEPGRPRPGLFTILKTLVVAFIIIYAGNFWLIRRVVVGPSEVLVLLKKDGTRSLPGGQIIIPRPPDAAKNPDAYAQWKKEYGNCNGVLEEVFPAGTYFKFSPWDYE